jgi:YggT family protein
VHGVALFGFWILQLWVIAAIGRAILSWFPISYGSPWHRVNTVLVTVTEPFIAPVRRVIRPVGIGGVGVDLSFMVVVLVVQLIAVQLRNYAY